MAFTINLDEPVAQEDFAHKIDELVQGLEDEDDRNKAITLADAAKGQVQSGAFGQLVVGSLSSEKGIELKPAQ